jgi:hypothetical protein
MRDIEGRRNGVILYIKKEKRKGLKRHIKKKKR